MRMKKILAGFLSAVMVLSMAACGGGGGSDGGADGSGSAASGGSTDTLEMRVWDGDQVNGLREICDEWTAQSGIKVNLQAMNWNEYFTLLEAGASGGQMPDVFWMHSTVAELYMSNDLLLNLDEYIERDGVDLNNYYGDIVDIYTYEGSHYALPKDHDTIALLYNKAIFDQYGVEYPNENWTWEDLYTAAKAITDASGGEVYGIAADVGSNQDCWWNMVYDYGGYVINEDKTKSGMDDPKTLEAMEFLGKLIKDAMPPQSVISETGKTSLFNSGVIAMTTQGSWSIMPFYTNDNKDNYAWEVLPYCDRNGNGQVDEGERVSIYAGIGWSAAANTKDPEAAWDLIKFLTSKEMQVKQADLGVTMAGYIGASDTFADAFPGMDISAFLKTENEAVLVPRPHSKYTNNWETKMGELLVTAWNDTTQMESVCRQIADEMNALLAQE